MPFLRHLFGRFAEKLYLCRYKKKFLDKIILKENFPKVIGDKDISFFSG